MTQPLLLLLALTVALSLAGCAANPVSGKRDFVMMSEAQEIALGRSADAEVRKQYSVYQNPELQSYVNGVGQALASRSHRSNLNYHFTVVDSPEINAFALPGGYVYITRGIMAYLNSEAEMAAVLGTRLATSPRATVCASKARRRQPVLASRWPRFSFPNSIHAPGRTFPTCLAAPCSPVTGAITNWNPTVSARNIWRAPNTIRRR